MVCRTSQSFSIERYRSLLFGDAAQQMSRLRQIEALEHASRPREASLEEPALKRQRQDEGRGGG